MAGQGRPGQDSAGIVIGAFEVAHDITERKRAEEALRQSHERLEWVLETTGVGSWLNELPLGGLNWDSRTRELFFIPPGVEPTIELFWERLHPEDHEPTRLAIEAALRDGTLYAIDHRAVDPVTGAIRWIIPPDRRPTPPMARQSVSTVSITTSPSASGRSRPWRRPTSACAH